MKTYKLILFALMSLCLSNVMSAATNSLGLSSESETTELIGIWHNQNASNYYYEFKPDGEYVRYKIKNDGRGNKSFGLYSVNGHIINMIYNGEETTPMEFHVDGNTLVLFIDKERKTVCQRISKADFEKVTHNLEWYY